MTERDCPGEELEAVSVSSSPSRPRPGLADAGGTAAKQEALDIALLVAVKVALGAWVLRLGFSHVSDDDYARVVIAQLFAHSPRLDPSGTSWLPLPFWTVGGAMILFGRSLATARTAAIVLGCAGVAAVYLALRRAGVARGPALLGVAVGMATPWSAWLGVATVPEASTGGLIAAGAVLAGRPGARLWGSVGLFVAALSRYEAWPVCATLVLSCAWSAARGGRTSARQGEARGRLALTACIALAGPILWLVWNAHAHDGPLHFLHRVTAYRARFGDARHGAIALFPSAFVEGAPDVCALAAVGSLGLLAREMRRRWAWPLGAAVALLAFLVCGDASGGAPTHHPARALVAAYVILAAFGADGVWCLARRWAWGRPKREAWGAALVVGLALTWAFSAKERLGSAPGEGELEDRTAQVARGRDLAARGVASFDVTPCEYEYFALLAAYGSPENARILAPDPRARGCPEVQER